jgi:tRNA(Ile)-lysidine synthetase-like protein
VFRTLHPALQRRFIHWAVAQIGGVDNETGYIHITAAVTAGTQGETGTITLLAGGLRLRVDYEAIIVEREDAPLVVFDSLLLPAGTEIGVTLPGITTIPGQSWQLRADFVPIEGYQARLNISEKRKIFLRTRKSGDVFAPFGLGGHTQSIKKWMIDHKVPQSLRDSMPLLVIDDQIAAILYGETWPISDQFSVKKDKKRVLYLRANTDL